MFRSAPNPTRKTLTSRERRELAAAPELESEELIRIYVDRGLEIDLARQVARQPMAKDALGAHARDELGVSDATSARPIQAAFATAASFSLGAAAPLALVLLAPAQWVFQRVGVGSLTFLAFLGKVGAKAGGGALLRPTIRVTFWGALAMGLTTGSRMLIGHAV